METYRFKIKLEIMKALELYPTYRVRNSALKYAISVIEDIEKIYFQLYIIKHAASFNGVHYILFQIYIKPIPLILPI